ncbi:ribonuclease HII [Devosia algicola]|uniref:Ribonuclease HII n=1 Tax=Devosia algicola TaxID=3026418 RepID=A0ABY7YMK4_9HYPH|nr:ribonuclease HII [Devosia algicola]WDR02541.1 ribonuclease HII [Devosia algicola]
MARGARIIAGIDEAGRGPLAGPVVVAAVVLNADIIPTGLNDSKKLNARQREALFDHIVASGAAIAVVAAPPQIIQTRNIRGATLWAMAQSANGLSRQPDCALIDGRDVPPGMPCQSEALIGGDGRSVSIAAASIVAKVMRDRMCAIMDCDAPQFGFSGHKGYGTPQHLAALGAHGPCRHHRADFAPVVQFRLGFAGTA